MRLTIAVDLDYAIIGPPTDVLLQIEAAATPDQRIVAERLTIWSDHPIAAVAGEDGVGQRCWIRAEQWLKAEYRATVDVERAPVDLAPLRATPVRYSATISATSKPSRSWRCKYNWRAQVASHAAPATLISSHWSLSVCRFTGVPSSAVPTTSGTERCGAINSPKLRRPSGRRT